MATTQPGDVRMGAQEAQALTLLERVQIGSAIGGALLTLTYISGYLTATAYLGTYSISADTSELLRAKYIYIGFEYWLFVAIAWMFINVLSKFLNLSIVSNPLGNRKMRSNVRVELLKRRRNPNSPIAKIRLLRWAFAASMVTVVLSLEMLLMSPGGFKHYLSLQALFLLTFSLYQTTFYREYTKETYGWGILWGRILVRWIRWGYSLFPGLVCVLLMAKDTIIPHLGCSEHLIHARAQMLAQWFERQERFPPVRWVFIPVRWVFLGIRLTFSLVQRVGNHLYRGHSIAAWIALILTLSVACFITLDKESLEWADKKYPKLSTRMGFIVIVFVCFYAALGFFLDAISLLLRRLPFFRTRPWLLPRRISLLLRVILLSIELLFQHRSLALLYRRIKAAHSTYTGNTSGPDGLWRLLARLFDSAIITAGATLYCLLAFDVWDNDRFLGIVPAYQSVILCAYGTLAIALIILTNIIRLSWMHQERDRDLAINSDSNRWALNFDSSILTPGVRTIGRTIVPLTVLYLVSVLGFAHLIYPFIPLDKAGGNYSLPTKPVLIALNTGGPDCSSTDTSLRSLVGQRLYVIEDTSNWIYFAPANSAQGPNCWKWGVFCKRANEDDPFRPQVFQVNRHCVASIYSNSLTDSP